LIDYAVAFLSRYVYAVLFSAVLSATALVVASMVGERAYKKRTTIFISSLFCSFLISVWITSICLVHWFTMGYESLYHIACSEISFSLVEVVCTSWVRLMTATLSLTFSLGAVNYFFGERIATCLYRVKPLNQSQAGHLHEILTNLSQRAGLEAPKIGLIESSTPHIFSVGRREKAAIVLSVGLIETLSYEEIEACLAHEVSHMKNKDGLVKTLASILKFSAPFNFFGYLVQPAVSRDREFLADKESVRMTKKPRALISALIKIYESFAISPKKGIFTGFSVKFFDLGAGRLSIFNNHPSIEERLERLLEFENEMQIERKVPS